jgi:hypothetical protein
LPALKRGGYGKEKFRKEQPLLIETHFFLVLLALTFSLFTPEINRVYKEMRSFVQDFTLIRGLFIIINRIEEGGNERITTLTAISVIKANEASLLY